MALGETSNEGLVSVDNSGCVRLWETGIANLERSLEEWRRMTGLEHQQLTIQRDIVKDLGGPKHGEVDPDNMPHVGGNTWAGGTGGRDTAGQNFRWPSNFIVTTSVNTSIQVLEDMAAPIVWILGTMSTRSPTAPRPTCLNISARLPAT